MISKCSNCGAHVPEVTALRIVHAGAARTFCSAQCADAQLRDTLSEAPPLPRRILVAVDGSGPSVRAVETAVTLAAAARGEIRLLTAIDSSWLRGTALLPHAGTELKSLTDQAEQLLREGAEAQLDRCRRICKRAEVPCSVAIEARPPLEAILAAAADVDLIVMGSRGRDALSGASLGSLAQRVITSTQTRVLVVH
jgi:nucleotide-binding universal stress UspA family protein